MDFHDSQTDGNICFPLLRRLEGLFAIHKVTPFCFVFVTFGLFMNFHDIKIFAFLCRESLKVCLLSLSLSLSQSKRERKRETK